MSETNRFRTRHEFISRSHPKGKNYIIGLDMGYSGVKVFHEKGYFCFPYYAKKISEETIDVADEKDILFKDLETGDVYIVGRTAQEMVSSLSTNDTDGALYSRKRYYSKLFQVLCQAAIGLVLLEKNDNREIFISTGLPSAYLKADKNGMVYALTRPAKFAIKKGTGTWKTYSFTLSDKDIMVTAQPSGTYYSMLILNDGRFLPNAAKIISENVLVMDIGYGTCDFYGMKSRSLVCTDSINNIGMRVVMDETRKRIFLEYGEDIGSQAMQNLLEKGSVTCFDEANLTQEEKPFQKFLEESSEKVFREAMEQAKAVTDSFRDYKYLIVTGGTGKAWFEKIKRYLSGMKQLEVIEGTRNDVIDAIYSNVRGYYMYRYIKEKNSRE